MREELFILRLTLGVVLLLGVFVVVNAISQKNSNEYVLEKVETVAADVELLKAQAIAHNAVTDSVWAKTRHIDTSARVAALYAQLAAANTASQHSPNYLRKNAATHGRQFADRK